MRGNSEGKLRQGKNRMWRAVMAVILMAVAFLEPVMTVNAITVYESDGVFHEEGYIFIGESHCALASGAIPERDIGNDISYSWIWDASRGSEENVFTMKGNLFFVFEGNGQNDGAVQTSADYIYSDGKGSQGRGVQKIHEIINTNPNIAHWNIISMHGAVSASKGTKAISDYYVNSYRNWMTYEFPEADCWFLSVATMTKYYRGTKDKKIFNNTIAAAFPDRFLDYTEFYASRSPQRMIDTIHWDEETYFDLISDVIRKVRERKQGMGAMPDVVPDYVVAEVQAVCFTNEATVIFEQPDISATALFPTVEAGFLILVTGVTDNGYFRVGLGELVGFVPAGGLTAGE